MRKFRSPNSGQTALTLQHSTSPRSGYRPPVGHNADGYTMAERVGLRKGGSVSGKMKDLPDHLRHSLVNQAKSRAKKGFKKGGWIQDVNKSIKKRGTKGKCTPITKKGCTGRAKALAKTFKKMARKRKGK